MNILNSKNLINTSNSICHYKDPKGIEKLSKYLSANITATPLVLCIGTDRCIGDALGPLVGSILTKSSPYYPIHGTLEKPIHALNISSSLREIKQVHKNVFIIAVDASLGNKEDIGNIIIRKGPIYPGKGVGKKLPAAGDLSIVGIVEDMNCDISTAINNIRLNFIMSMAEAIASIIKDGLITES